MTKATGQLMMPLPVRIVVLVLLLGIPAWVQADPPDFSPGGIGREVYRDPLDWGAEPRRPAARSLPSATPAEIYASRYAAYWDEMIGYDEAELTVPRFPEFTFPGLEPHIPSEPGRQYWKEFPYGTPWYWDVAPRFLD